MTEAERLLLILVAVIGDPTLEAEFGARLRAARQALDDEAHAEHARAAPQSHAQGAGATGRAPAVAEAVHAASDAPAGSTGVVPDAA